jgi:hypothetical protein
MPGTHGGAQQDAGCNGKQPSAANVSKAVDFLKMAKQWTIHVHIFYAQNDNPAQHERIYYRLPEQCSRGRA